MKLLTKDTDYAVRALSYIARQKTRIVTVKELCKSLKIPRPFLRKILQILNKKKLLKSYKGKGGGFMLSRAPSRIFVIDLIKIFQGPIKLNEHIFKKGICPHIRTCVLKTKLDRIEKDVIGKLETITIASLRREL
jgi:Rrf2 family protein